MKIMKRIHRGTIVRMIIVVLSTAPAASAFALDWPVENTVVTETFGADDGDHFLSGIELGGGSQEVHAADSGDVIFRFEEGDDPHDIPTGLGSFLVVQDSQSQRTIYAHLQRGSQVTTQKSVSPGDVVGISGDTGNSPGENLLFSVIDLAKGAFVNPLTVLPPLADSVAPVISTVSLTQSGAVTPLGPSATVAGGDYRVLVDVSDPSQYVAYYSPLAPYEVDVSLDGRQVLQVTYDAIVARDGSAYLSSAAGEETFSDYYTTLRQIRLGTITLTEGAVRMIVNVRDFAGNTATKGFLLNVTPPAPDLTPSDSSAAPGQTRGQGG